MARFSILPISLWDVPRNEIIKAETPEIYAENRPYTIPGFVVLVQDKELGNVLFDTGIAVDWKETWPPQFFETYKFHEFARLTDRLAELDLAPEDMDMVVCSHLHYDHGGNVKLFAGTKAGKEILISSGEAHEAIVNSVIAADGVSGAYYRPEIVVDGVGYELLHENRWISEDIFLFIQRGHTPGVIGMLVKTEKSGNFIFTSDGIYSPTNFGPPVVLPGLCADPENYAGNVEYVADLAKEYDAQIIFGHDVDDFERRRKSPEFYE